MNFGKRGGGRSAPAPVQSTQQPKPLSIADDAELLTSKRNLWGNSFKSLGFGILVLVAGFFAAPVLFGGAGHASNSAQLAGLSRDEVKGLMDRDASQTGESAAFMQKLKTHFPSSHDRLLSGLAEVAMSGGSSEDSGRVKQKWTAQFLADNGDAIASAGAAGFDRGLDHFVEFVRFAGHATGDCTFDGLGRTFANPWQLSVAQRAEGKRVTSRVFEAAVDLAVIGGKSGSITPALTRQDEAALTDVMAYLMSHPQLRDAAQAISQGRMGQAEFNREVMSKLDICEMDPLAMPKLKSLPAETKGHVWALVVSTARNGLANASFSAAR